MSSTAGGKGRRKTGTLKGQVSVFAGGEMHVIEVDSPITVGREKGNKIRLRDDLVSRVHCRISPTETGFLLEDQASRNGTWLNGIRVERAEIKSGDVVDVGRCTLFFTTPDRETHLDFQVAEGKEDGGRQTIEYKALGGARATGLDGRGPVGVEELSAIVRDRNKLLHLSQITKAITSEQDLDRLFEKIIDSATELTQARRGFLVLPEGRDFAVAVARPPRETGGADGGPDKRTVRRALQEGRLSRTTVKDGEGSRSVICLPCRVLDEVIGAVYLDVPADEKTFTEDDERILTTFSDQAAIAIKNARFAREMKDKRAIEKELEIAGQIQRHLLPSAPPLVPGLDIFGESLAAKEVGGDYFDFIRSPDGNRLAICIADVSGKGISAGLIMVMARSILRSLVWRCGSTRDVLFELNRILSPDLEQGRFISMILLLWDAAAGALRYTGAGHEHLLIYRAAEGRCERTPAGGAVLGIPWEGLESRFEEKRIDLAPGDHVLLYTDGATDVRNHEGEFFGLRRLQRIVETQGELAPDHLVYTILEKVSSFQGPEIMTDDITLIAMRRRQAD